MSRIEPPFGLWTAHPFEHWKAPLPSSDAVNHYRSTRGRNRRYRGAKHNRSVMSPKTARRRAKKAANAAKEKQRE